jgi:amino acid transporter
LAAVNVAGVRVAANTSNLFAAGKLIPLAVFVAAGLFFLDPARFSLSAVPDYRPFSQSVMLLVYAFTGFEMAVIPAGEARKPGRDLPIALMAGMAVVVVFYVLIQVVAIGTLPELASSQRPLADAAARFLGPGGAMMITVGIVVSLAGNLNVLMLSASRVIFAMAEHGELPPSLATIHQEHRTPWLAVLATAAIMLGLTLSGTFLWLLTLSTLARLVAYMATAGALPVLRRSPQAPEAKFRLPGGVVVSLASIGLGFWLLSNSTLREARDTAIAAGIGVVVYYSYRAGRRLAGSPERQDTIEP